MPEEWRLPTPIVTDRLELRPHASTDLDDLLAFHADPEVTAYLPWPERRTRTEVEAFLARHVEMDAARAPGEWIDLAIVERDSGTVIGSALLKRPEDESGPTEVGYVIRRDRWGRGIASEAVAALLAAARDALGLTRFAAVVERGNDASIRLLERFGFVEVESGDPALRTFERAGGATGA